MDLITFLKNSSMKYAKKDSRNDLNMLPLDPIIINTPNNISFLKKMMFHLTTTESFHCVHSKINHMAETVDNALWPICHKQAF